MERRGEYIISASPTKGDDTYRQTKKVDVCLFKNSGRAKIHFELKANETQPVMQYKIENKSSVISDKSKEQKQLEMLKKLKDEGIITEEEYKEKSLKIIETME